MPRTWFDADAVEQVVDVGFRFARDSSLEGDGFEPSVPRQISSLFESSPVSRDGLRVSQPGTERSNPSPSSGESYANLTSTIGAFGLFPT